MVINALALCTANYVMTGREMIKTDVNVGTHYNIR